MFCGLYIKDHLRTNIKSNSSTQNSNGSIASALITVVKNTKISGLPIQTPSIKSQVTNCIKQQQHEKSTNIGPILPIPPAAHSLSMSDVSDMLFEFYKANTAKAPKNNKINKVPRQKSPSSADGANDTEVITSTPTITITPTKIEQKLSDNTVEPHSTTTTTTNTKCTVNESMSFPKNVNGDEMVATTESIKNATPIQTIVKEFGKKINIPFHPRIKYSSINNKSSPPAVILPPTIPSTLSSGTTTIQPVLTCTNSSSSTSSSPAKTQSPLVVIPSSVIQSPILSTQPAAAALAAALFRDGYQNFHQQIRAQEQLLKHQRQHDQQSNTGVKSIEEQSHSSDNKPISGPTQLPPKYMHNFLRKDNRYSDENEQQSSSDEEDEDDDEGKYPEIDDIHLIEGAKSAFNAANQMSLSMDADYMSDESHKYSMIAAHALRNLEYSWSDYGGRSGEGNGGMGPMGPNGEIESMYNCRHCGKKYRWKSTLRRHENVECGGKEPSHQCPYCPYKSKQRGNLGVHVRKHHANLPQLASKRRSKYSQPRD